MNIALVSLEKSFINNLITMILFFIIKFQSYILFCQKLVARAIFCLQISIEKECRKNGKLDEFIDLFVPKEGFCSANV